MAAVTLENVGKVYSGGVDAVRGVNVAVADGDYQIGDRMMWTTFTMVRLPEGWKITAIRNALHTTTSPAGSPTR